MWCRHCQQDVPAIARLGDAMRVCPRCASPLRRPPLSSPAASMDAGIELDAAAASPPLRPPVTSPFDSFGTQLALSQIRRRLRPLGGAPTQTQPLADHQLEQLTWRVDQAEPAITKLDDKPIPTHSRTRKPNQSRWVGTIVLLTTLGSTALVAGVAMLFGSSAMTTAPVTVRALSLAFAGQGLLYFALAGMFARLAGGVCQTCENAARPSSPAAKSPRPRR